MTSPVEYDPNIPENPSDSLASTQPEFLNNFTALFNTFLRNHISLTAAANAGNHTVVELVEQENSQQTNVGEVSAYTRKIDDISDQIFLRYQGNGQEFAYTCYQIYALTPGNQISYFTFLPGKILVYFGSYTLLPNNLLTLFPPIAKRIMSLSFCMSGNNPTPKPNVAFEKQPTGFIKDIKVGFGSTFIPSPPGYYLILANI